ncbi:MAG: hypothetical protein ACI4QT_11000 [Kiritimatiellia bacterium]
MYYIYIFKNQLLCGLRRAVAAAALFFAAGAFDISIGATALKVPEADIGWIDTSYTTVPYTDPACWQDGIVSGAFYTNINSKITKVITVEDGYAFSNGILFAPGSKHEGTTSLRSTGNGMATISWLGDFLLNSGAGKTGYFEFGSTADNQNLLLDFGGGNRTFSLLGNGGGVALYGDVRNGRLAASGTRSLKLANPGEYPLDLTASGTTTALLEVFLDHATRAFPEDRTRFSSFSANSVALKISGNAAVDTVETLPENMLFSCPFGLQNRIVFVPNASHSLTLKLPRLNFTPDASIVLTGSTLGQTPDAGVANFLVEDVDSLQLSPALGTDNALPVVPGFFGASSETGVTDSFVTYDAETGFRILAPEECQTNIVSGSQTTDNVYLSNTAQFVIDEDTTINSLFMASGSCGVSGTGPLTISSGMIFYPQSDNCFVSTPVHFGERRGIISTPFGKRGSIGNGISGTGGLLFVSASRTETRNTFSISAGAVPSTFTGDVHFNAYAVIYDSNFLPHGDRSGDVYARGRLSLNGGVVMNGLYGFGDIINAYSNGGTFSVGDNDADGDWAGSVTASTMSLVKIGAGTLRLSGLNHAMKALTVQNGVLTLDGAIASETTAVTIQPGATLNGCGSFAGDVTLQANTAFGAISLDADANDGSLDIGGNLILESGSFALNVGYCGEDQIASVVNVTGAVSAADDSIVYVNFPERKNGRHVVMTAAGGFGSAEFRSGENSGRLSFSDDGTVLYCDHAVATTIIFR